MNAQSQLLLDPDKWPSATIREVMAEMTTDGVGSVRFALARKGDVPVFALIMVNGENTQAVLNAVDAVEDEEQDSAAGQLARIRAVMQKHLSPVGSSKHEAIAGIAAILAEGGAEG